jgi:hypothetical protein
MIGAKSTVAKYWEELKMAAALPRSAVGNQEAATLLLAGKAGDSERPTMKRRMNRTIMAVAALKTPMNPWSKVKNDQKKILKA